jgi:UDP-N-acetylmuramate: L-alanyl-gamma-D-glutamyl-meso-diaminopimelate ligase
MGCWSEVELVGQDDAKWKAVKLADDGSAFEVWLDGVNRARCTGSASASTTSTTV